MDYLIIYFRYPCSNTFYLTHSFAKKSISQFCSGHFLQKTTNIPYHLAIPKIKWTGKRPSTGCRLLIHRDNRHTKNSPTRTFKLQNPPKHTQTPSTKTGTKTHTLKHYPTENTQEPIPNRKKNPSLAKATLLSSFRKKPNKQILPHKNQEQTPGPETKNRADF